MTQKFYQCMSARMLLVFAALLVSTACLAQSSASVDTTKSDPIAYLNTALDEIQKHALRRETVNWPRIRAEALSRAAHAETTVDTYDAIRFALTSLDDHHSSLHLTPALETLESQRRGPRTSPQSQQSVGPFVGRYEPEGRIEKTGDKIFALIVVTKCFPEKDSEFKDFETKLQHLIADLDRSHPSGWVVDLRGNVGGNMWPMLTGAGPLLGERDHFGEFFNVEGHSVWQYRDGVAAEVENGKRYSYPAVSGVPYKLVGEPKVAVLIDRGTASSGEAIAIAFRGRTGTRFFGEHSAGVSTVNQGFTLSDGASIWLTIGVQADSTGKQYLGGIEPDESIPAADKILPDDRDPTLQSALRWLSAESH